MVSSNFISRTTRARCTATNYGYRSGLNRSMVEHLQARLVRKIRGVADPKAGRPRPRHRQQRRHAAAGVSRERPDARRHRSDRRRSSRKYYPPRHRADPRLLLRRARSSRRRRTRRAKSSRRSRCSTTSSDRSTSCATIARGPRGRRRLALRAELHAVDAAHELLRHDLPRAPRVLLARGRSSG